VASVQSNELSDLITLRVTATTGHVGVARAAATAIAAPLDFTYDRLTDLHIAIDEACGRVLATSDPPAGHFELTFEPGEAGLTVTVRGDGGLKPGAQFLNSWSRTILEAVARDIELLEAPDGRVGVRFRVEGGE